MNVKVGFLFLLLSFIFIQAFDPPDAILLQDVKVLTLYRGRYANARRTSVIPQISCVGGSAARRYEPDVIQCTNVGWDGTDFQWKCESELPDDYHFGRITVTCEGYNSPQDPYVLKGSCGVEYELEFTEKGRKRAYGDRGDYYKNEYNGETDFGTLISWLIIIVMIIVFFNACCGLNTNASSRSGSSNYGGGGDGGGGPNLYPPPYDDIKYPSSVPPATGSGFWTGAFTGGMLGYIFGSRNSRHSTWGSGWNSSYRSSSGSSSPSSSSRSSSGFGGTRRR